MTMVTTCPHCATSFNVAPEVLLSRNGRVRCGQCKQIFDGLLSATTPEAFQSAAVDSGPVAQDAPAPPVASVEIHWPALPGVPEMPVPPMPLEVTAAASPEYLPGNQPATAPAVSTLPAPHGQPKMADSPRVSAAFKAPVTEEEPLPDDAIAPPSPKRRLWTVAAGMAALLLATQVIYRYRSEIAAHFPPAKPALAQVCEWAGCSVPPLQQPAALNIEASDLQVVDKAQPHIVQLTATLRNRASVALGYPALDLVLTDNREHALARRVIVPKDYLPGPVSQGAQAVQSTIAANAEITVRVDLDLSGLPAAGFRLTLTPAPSY